MNENSLMKLNKLTLVNIIIRKQNIIDRAIEYIKTESDYNEYRGVCEKTLNYKKVNILLNDLKEEE